MNRTLVLSIVNKGTNKHPRAVLCDQNGWFWTPSGWTAKEQEAMLFYGQSDASRKAEELLRAHFGCKPGVRYQAPVYIDLYSDKPIALEQLQAWLHKASQLFVNTPKFGNGPIDGSLGVVSIDWKQLEKRT